MLGMAEADQALRTRQPLTVQVNFRLVPELEPNCAAAPARASRSAYRRRFAAVRYPASAAAAPLAGMAPESMEERAVPAGRRPCGKPHCLPPLSAAVRLRKFVRSYEQPAWRRAAFRR